MPVSSSRDSYLNDIDHVITLDTPYDGAEFTPLLNFLVKAAGVFIDVKNPLNVQELRHSSIVLNAINYKGTIGNVSAGGFPSGVTVDSIENYLSELPYGCQYIPLTCYGDGIVSSYSQAVRDNIDHAHLSSLSLQLKDIGNPVTNAQAESLAMTAQCLGRLPGSPMPKSSSSILLHFISCMGTFQPTRDRVYDSILPHLQSSLGPLPARAATTLAPTSLGASNATLHGTVQSRAHLGSAYFEWSTNPTFKDSQVTCSYPYCPVQANFAAQPFVYDLEGLTSSVTYYARLVFYDSSNNTYVHGNTISFTTLTPVRKTNPATAITASSASLNGVVDSLGDTGGVYFDWGTHPTLKEHSSTCLPVYCPVPDEQGPHSFSHAATGLASNTLYYYRIVFYDQSNDSYQPGPTLSFTTLNPVATTQAATLITGSSAALKRKHQPTERPGTCLFRVEQG